ncbi:MAG: hypothetical protein JSU89_16890 [Myxococcales bacterium]|nr:MAG: hypothetical protein JSU89_16890 [Myxococcales bacterium]
MKRFVQLGSNAPRRCPCLGVLCFLCAFVASLFGAHSASADTPPAAIKTTPLAAPAAVLGVTNPHVIAGAVKSPQVIGFTFSRDLRSLYLRVEKLAIYGVDLNQRKMPRAEKLNLRVNARLGGGVLQICYRR